MEIITKEYNFNSEEYLSILLRQYAKKRWLFWLVLFGIWSFLLPLSESWYIYVGAIIFSFVYSYFSYRKYAYSPKNKNLLGKRTYRITEQEFEIKKEDGKINVLPWDYFVKLDKLGKHYLLFTNQSNFIPISKDVFKSEIDNTLFEKYVKQIK